MKKSLIFMSFLLVVLLSGCSAKTTENTTNNENIDTVVSEVRNPDFQRPERDADIRGLVKNLVGNEATILKVTRPEREEGDEVVEEKAPTDTGTRIPGMGGGGGTGGGSGSTLDPDARLEMLKSMSTGEEKVLIPVGIKMLKNIDGEVSEATLLDVTNDKMLNIWLDTSIEGRNVAEFVMIN